MADAVNFDSYSNDSLGPIQKDEAIFLYGLTCAVCPRSVLEFGTLRGHSTDIWLAAGAKRVVSVDILTTPQALEVANEYPNLELVRCDQTAYMPTENFDIIFMDAAHDLEANKQTFENVGRHISEGGLLIVHDTGLWRREFMTGEHHRFPGKWETPNDFAHQPDERAFVLWLKSQGLNAVNIHSSNTLRHGMTILQFT
jgi:SAM-dependent methyltransferase